MGVAFGDRLSQSELTLQRFSFQFAGNDSRVSVVQYSGARAQEVVQLGVNTNSVTDFKQ